jgi:hypothetical protein
MKNVNRLFIGYTVIIFIFFLGLLYFELPSWYIFSSIIVFVLTGLYDYPKAKAKDDLKYKEELKKVEGEELRIKIEKLAEEQKNMEIEKFNSNKQQLNNLKDQFNLELDKNQDGNIDLISCDDFMKILKINQSKIIEIDKTYLQKFVKISSFLNTKNNDIIKLYDEFLLFGIMPEDLNELIKKLRSKGRSIHTFFEHVRSGGQLQELSKIRELIFLEIHTYESVIFHSISMITALLKNDLITFYEIFESFDKLGIFNSNWENVVSEKLSNIEDKLDDLIESIEQLDYRISNSLDSLSYTTESSFKELNKSVSGQLSEIGSSLKFNNLLTGIQVYQTNKLNKSMKKLN